MKLDKAPSSAVELHPQKQVWRVGDWVEVRSLIEIMATLDTNGALEAMPFAPEMVPYCGLRFQIIKVAHKTCDSSGWDYLRTLKNAVHLNLRCNGHYHGGCQAGCRFFWKTAWLKKVDGPSPDDKRVHQAPCPDVLRNLACSLGSDGEMCYRCQATELQHAAEKLSPWNLTPYLRDIASGNVKFFDFVWYGSLALLKTIKVMLVAFKRRMEGFLGLPERPRRKTPPSKPLHLKPGDKVRIRGWQEVIATLNDARRNVGLLFDPDMVQYCGTVHEVECRVERIIDEKTGKMTRFSTESVILKGVACTGLNCRMRLFCPRGQPSFWREAWLEKLPSED
jgi:hypothetical protein